MAVDCRMHCKMDFVGGTLRLSMKHNPQSEELLDRKYTLAQHVPLSVSSSRLLTPWSLPFNEAH